MEKKKKNLSFIKNIVIIDFWVFLLFLNEFVIVSQMIEKVNSDNMKNYVTAILLVLLIYSLGILLNVRNLIHELKRQIPLKKNIISYLFQVIFISCAFVGLFEAGLDSATTTKQVRSVLTFIQGNAFKIKMKSFDIVLDKEKADYEIGDKISYDITYKPFFANSKDITYELDNEIVSIDLANKTITCLSNGECTITFYDTTNDKVKTTLNLVIDSEVLEDIDLGENLDIFLNTGDVHELKPKLYPAIFEGEKVDYISSDSEVAMVDANGKITALSSGHATITCSCLGVTKKVYVCVDPILNFQTSVDKYTFLSTTEGYGSFYLKFDDISSFKASYIKFDYHSDYEIKIAKSSLNIHSKTYSFTITNNDSNKDIDEVFPLTISYVYPGGYTISKTIEITISSGKDYLVSEINFDKTKLSYDIDLYYDTNGYLVTQYYEFPITYYKTTEKKNERISYATSSEGVDFSCTTYNKVVMEFLDQENVKNLYFINFYPSKNLDDYIQIAVKINKKTISSNDSSFEMTRLYEQSENLKNEIWPTYFTKSLFELYSFSNPEFKYSGLKIIPVGNTLDYIDFEVSDFGYVSKCSLKGLTKQNYVKECRLEFDICSLYEYHKDRNCPKYRYVIDIKNDYDDLLVSLNGSEYTSENFEYTILKGETITVSFQYPVKLEHKGKFQTKFYRSGYVTVTKAGDKTILPTVSYNAIVAGEYGITEITYSLNSKVLTDLHPITIKINVVDEYGNIPTPKKIDVVVTSKDSLEPVIDKGKFSIGTTLDLSVLDVSEYIFESNNNDIVLVTSDGKAQCLKPGSATISATNKEDNSEIYFYDVSVYRILPTLVLEKGSFNEMTLNNNQYRFIAKTNTAYNLTLSGSCEVVKYVLSKEYENVKISDDGSIIIEKAGTYSGYVQIGEDGSPYMYRLPFVIVCDDNGVSANFLYFVRKLFGHFGLFLILSAFASLSVVLYRPKNYYLLVANVVSLCGYIFIISYSSEFIQGLNPTRTNSFNDVMINYRGALLGIVIVTFGYLIVKSIMMIIKAIKKALEKKKI